MRSYDAHDEETPTADPDPSLHARRVRVPALTILAHPDVLRLGQCARLERLLVRRPVLLSRRTPMFGLPGAEEDSPLSHVSISRAGVQLSALDEDDALLVSPNGVRLHVDGLEVSRPTVLAASAIARGVGIRLSSRIALILHFVPEQTARDRHPALLGCSPALEELRCAIDRAGAARAPVLILGESGTGKELIATAIHRASHAAAHPLVSVNMATLHEATAASQLFGHERGAFTGASASHAGLFEQAQRGSLLLDEIADAPLAVQTMLLRALECGVVRPVGAARERVLDVRFIAATEHDILDERCPQPFRAALAQRLSALVVRVPALREHRADIPLLLRHFLTTLDPAEASELWRAPSQCTETRLPADTMLALMVHPFPGNVRELRNLAHRMLAFGSAQAVLAANPFEAQSQPAGSDEAPHGLSGGFGPSRKQERLLTAKDALAQTLSEHDFSPARAARAMGVPNSTLHHWMKKHALLRRASDVPEAELRAAARSNAGDLVRMATALNVSIRGLRLRLSRARSADFDTLDTLDTMESS